MDSVLALEAGFGGLEFVSGRYRQRDMKSLTSEHGAFKQLNELVDLNEHIDRHFEIGEDLE